MRFEKVSLGEWISCFDKQFKDKYTEEEIISLYNKIQLPKAGTEHAAGADFYCPIDVVIQNGCSTFIPTGIRWITESYEKDTMLMLVPRSGLGAKFGMRLLNTVGIVDADYYYASNEGHIMAWVTAERELYLDAGERFMQGIVLQYYRCGEDVKEKRTGGFGSTGDR